MEFLKKFTKSWKTTIAGIFIALNLIINEVSLFFDTDVLTNPSWQVIAAQAAIAIGLIFARDADKSSEETGVNPPLQPEVS